MSDFSDFRVGVSLSKVKLGLSFSAVAKSAERAAQVATEGRSLLAMVRAGMQKNPEVGQIMQGISVRSSGTSFSMSASVDVATLVRAAQQIQTSGLR